MDPWFEEWSDDAEATLAAQAEACLDDDSLLEGIEDDLDFVDEIVRF